METLSTSTCASANILTFVSFLSCVLMRAHLCLWRLKLSDMIRQLCAPFSECRFPNPNSLFPRIHLLLLSIRSFQDLCALAQNNALGSAHSRHQAKIRSRNRLPAGLRPFLQSVSVSDSVSGWPRVSISTPPPPLLIQGHALLWLQSKEEPHSHPSVAAYSVDRT